MPNFQDTSPATNFAAGLTSGLGLVAGVENLRASEVNRRDVESGIRARDVNTELNRRNTESVIRSRDVETNFAQLTQGLGIVERMDALKTAALTRQKIEAEMAHMPRRLALELDTARVVNQAERLRLDNLTQFGAEKALAELETANLAMGIERAKTQVQQAELKQAELAATHEAEFMSAAPEFLSADTMNPAAAYLSAIKLKRTFSDKLSNPHFGKAISGLRASAMDAKRSEYVPYLDSDGVRQYKPVERRFGDAVALARGNFEAGANMALDVFGVDRVTFTQMMEEYSAEGGRPFQAPSNETAEAKTRRLVEEGRKGRGGAPGAMTPAAQEIFYGGGEGKKSVNLEASRPESARITALIGDPGKVVEKIQDSPHVKPGAGKQTVGDLKIYQRAIDAGKSPEEARKLVADAIPVPISARMVPGLSESIVEQRLSLLDAALK